MRQNVVSHRNKVERLVEAGGAFPLLHIHPESELRVAL